MIVTAPFDRIVSDLRQDFRRYQRQPQMANHNLDTMRWAVMGKAHTITCTICQHAQNPDYSHTGKVNGKVVHICPECNQELRTNDVESWTDQLYEAQDDHE